MVRLNFSQQNRNESHKLQFLSVSHLLLQDTSTPLLAFFIGRHISEKKETDEKQQKPWWQLNK